MKATTSGSSGFGKLEQPNCAVAISPSLNGAANKSVSLSRICERHWGTDLMKPRLFNLQISYRLAGLARRSCPHGRIETFQNRIVEGPRSGSRKLHYGCED